MGAVGGIMSKELASAGLNVVGLERGPELEFEEYAYKDALRSSRKQRGNFHVGGGLMWWTGSTSRFDPNDFKVYSNEVASGVAEKAGADLDGYDIIDWPITYEELEPYYEKFEYEFGVSGQGGVNPFEGHRRNPYPMPPVRESARSRLFAEATARLGYHPYPTPCGVTSQNYQPPAPYDQRIPERPGCVYCGQCNGYGCHVQAKTSTAFTVIPVALETGNFDLRTGCTVFSIDTDGEDRASGASYFDREGRIQQIQARVVILGAYIYENSRLLLMSGDGKGTNPGLANSSGQVGRGIMAHGDVRTTGLFDDYHVNAFIGPNAGARIEDFNGNNFDHAGLGFIRGGTTGTSGGGTPLERYDNMPPDWPRWGGQYKEALAHYYTRGFDVNIQCESLPHRENRVDLDSRHKDRWGMPTAQTTFSFHQNERRMWKFMGTVGEEIMREMGARHVWSKATSRPSRPAGGTRMGVDPATSVVNGDCQAHDVENLFVIGSSVFTTMSGYPATPTLGALAYRTADYIKANRQIFR
jgi:gluconate 2-dehydrogenase alpha chain